MKLLRALARWLRDPHHTELTTTPEVPPAVDNMRGHDTEALRVCEALYARRPARRRNTHT